MPGLAALLAEALRVEEVRLRPDVGVALYGEGGDEDLRPLVHVHLGPGHSVGLGAHANQTGHRRVLPHGLCISQTNF